MSKESFFRVFKPYMHCLTKPITLFFTRWSQYFDVLSLFSRKRI